MGTIIDYVKWRGDLSFNQDDVNDIDLFALSIICILDFEDSITESDMTIGDLSEKYLEKNYHKSLGLIIPDDIKDLLKAMSESKRFKDIKLYDYVGITSLERQLQFSACTFKLKENLYFIGFSGTDDTIIGWKENFNMLYMDFIPAQEEAIKYVKNALEKHPGNFICGGHSKGGNKAIVGASFGGDDRVIKVLAYDSPGVSDYIAKSLEYNKTLYKIYAYIPNLSIIGRVLNHKEHYKVISCSAKGIAQHDPMIWHIEGNDFIYLDRLSEASTKIDVRLSEIIDEMNYDEKVGFCETLYKLFTASNSVFLKDLEHKPVSLLTSYFKLSREDKKYLYKPVMKLMKEKEFQKLILGALSEYRALKKRTSQKNKKDSN